jgi:transposase InsO family protein
MRYSYGTSPVLYFIRGRGVEKVPPTDGNSSASYPTSRTSWTSEGWLYLAVVLDLLSRMVVGWFMSATRRSLAH